MYIYYLEANPYITVPGKNDRNYFSSCRMLSVVEPNKEHKFHLQLDKLSPFHCV